MGAGRFQGTHHGPDYLNCHTCDFRCRIRPEHPLKASCGLLSDVHVGWLWEPVGGASTLSFLSAPDELAIFSPVPLSELVPALVLS